jgi:hypothetical protein
MDQNIWKILGTFSEAIDSNELAAAVKAQSFDGDYALSEEGITAIEAQAKGLMNVEGAIRNKDVKETLAKELKMLHKKSFLSKFEEDLRPAFEALGIDTTDVEFLSDKAGDIAEKIKALKSAKPTGENKELLASLENDKKELAKQLQDIEAGWQNKLNDQQSTFEQRRLKDQYMIKATSKQWAKVYQDGRVQKGILDSVFEDIQAKAILKMSEDGSIKLYDKELPDKEYYDGNKKIEFQTILDQTLDPYMQKSKPTPEHRENPVPNSTPTDLTPMQQSIRDNARRSEMV